MSVRQSSYQTSCVPVVLAAGRLSKKRTLAFDTQSPDGRLSAGLHHVSGAKVNHGRAMQPRRFDGGLPGIAERCEDAGSAWVGGPGARFGFGGESFHGV